MERYLRVLRSIPAGSTRSPREIAELAGKPGAARAVGRLVRRCAQDAQCSEPWHRVVAADGSLIAERAREQLERLRAERARPQDGESVRRWALACSAAFVVSLRHRRYRSADDPRIERFDPRFVEAFAEENAALARGFGAFESSAEDPLPVARNREPSDPPDTPPLALRIEDWDWSLIRAELEQQSWSRVRHALTSGECEALCRQFDQEACFDRSVEMAPHGFGIGRYRFLREPLLAPLAELRARSYRELAGLADRWFGGPSAALHAATEPANWEEFAQHCRERGQERPSSILLRYASGGVNHPHRDRYGDVTFPLQAVVLLSRPGVDFEGGTFHLQDLRDERREEILLEEGDLLWFPSATRYAIEGRGPGREVQHGMTKVTRGERFAFGLVVPLAR